MNGFPTKIRGGENAWPPARVVVGDDSSESAKKAGELSRGLGMIQRVRLGSVYTKIVRAAPGLVLVYPHS